MAFEPFLKKAIKVALGEGSSEVEAFGCRSRTLAIYVDDGSIKNIEEKSDQGMAVRVIRGKKIGQSSTTITSIRDAERCANTAVKLSASSSADPVFKSFPAGIKGGEVPDNYDKSLASMSPDALSQTVKDIVHHATEAGDVKVPTGLIRAAVIQYIVMNTNGAETEQHSTLLYAHFTSMTKGDEPGEGVNSHFSTWASEFDPSSFGRDLAVKARASRDAVHYKGQGKMTVIIPPDELAELLDSSAIFALNAENVHRQRSAWAKGEGEKVASTKLTFIDDPFDKRGMCSCAYDDEGSMANRKVLLDRGVLKGYMYDHYNALLAGKESTGNCLRRIPGDAQTVYRQPLDIAPVNFRVEPGEKRLEGIIGGIDHGVMIQKLASAEANHITGAFGLEIRCGHLIENGEIKGTIDHALLTGNMFEAMRNVRDVASEVKVVGSCILPAVAFEGMEIIGQ